MVDGRLVIVGRGSRIEGKRGSVQRFAAHTPKRSQAPMKEHASSARSERIRKIVGSRSESGNPVRRVWRLRERMLRLGIEFEDDDERIRKVVGRSERGER